MPPPCWTRFVCRSTFLAPLLSIGSGPLELPDAHRYAHNGVCVRTWQREAVQNRHEYEVIADSRAGRTRQDAGQASELCRK